MNASDILKYGHLTLMHSIGKLSDEQWTTNGACGVWSPKNIVAHLASEEYVLIDVLTYAVKGGVTPHLDRMRNGGATWNDDMVAERQQLSVKETLDEYIAAQAQVMKCLADVPVDLLRQAGTIPWYGMEYALDDYIVYGFYGHKREHSAQIDVFLDNWGKR